MTRWACGIAGDDRTFDRVEDLVVHQATDHDRIECALCGALVPDGYFAIRHAVEDHSREGYRRAYDLDPEELRHREEILDAVEAAADLDKVLDRLEN